MALRWYTTVVDCKDIAAQARWWAEVLGWKVEYEAADEVVIVPSHEEIFRDFPFEQVPPALTFVTVPEDKTAEEPPTHRPGATHQRRPGCRDRTSAGDGRHKSRYRPGGGCDLGCARRP